MANTLLKFRQKIARLDAVEARRAAMKSRRKPGGDKPREVPAPPRERPKDSQTLRLLGLERALLARGPGVTADRTVFHTPTPSAGSLPRGTAPRFAARGRWRRQVLNPDGSWQKDFKKKAFRPSFEIRSPRLKG